MVDSRERGDTRKNVRDLYDRFFGPDIVRREAAETLVVNMPFDQLSKLLNVARASSFEATKQKRLVVTPVWFARTLVEHGDLFTEIDNVPRVDEAIQKMRELDPDCEEMFVLLNPPDLSKVCTILHRAVTSMTGRERAMGRVGIRRTPDRRLLVFRYWREGILTVPS